MTTQTNLAADTTIIYASLNQLYLHDLNPRQDVSTDEIATLAGSIETCGLLQNLGGLQDADGKIGIVSAGTADIPVAEEAVVTARIMGNEVAVSYDVGVAGIHRILGQRKTLRECSVIVVVAGMEGALPSVVGGLVDVPVIAVPTSIGYGAAFGGIAALLGMLNSCSAGVGIVNIDNGFGAGYLAGLMGTRLDEDSR